MKQMEVTEKKIGDNTFYIKPFPAFVAVNISGDLASVVTPLLGGVAALVGGKVGEDGSSAGTEKNIMDVDVEDALMKKLLIDNKNISVESEATDGEVKLLSYDLANEVFCGDVQDMYILCFEVIRLNFKGFFSKIGDRFGDLKGILQMKAPGTQSTEN